MRPVIEIIADVKDGKEVPTEELKAAVLVQNAMIFQFRNDTRRLFKAGKEVERFRAMYYSNPEKSSMDQAIPSWMYNAENADPLEFFGPYTANLITQNR